MSRQPIEIEFTQTPEDVIATRLQAVHGFDSPKMQKMARRRAVIGSLIGPPVGALAVVGVFTIIALFQHGSSLRPSLLVGVAVFVGIWMYQVVRAATNPPLHGFGTRRLERIVRRTTDTSSLTSELYRLDDEGVTHEHDGIVMFFPWDSIDRASQVEGAWYLRANNEMLLRLPERAVPDHEALNAIISERIQTAN